MGLLPLGPVSRAGARASVQADVGRSLKGRMLQECPAQLQHTEVKLACEASSYRESDGVEEQKGLTFSAS